MVVPLASVGAAAAAGVFVATGRLGASLRLVAHTDPRLAWLAAVGFLVSLAASGLAWRAAFAACGARVGVIDACARYGAGSLVNSFLPARLGDGVRLGLFSRALPAEGRLLVAGGGAGAVTAARALVQGMLFAVAAGLGALPLWPLAAVGGVLAVAATAGVALRGRLRGRRLDHLLAAFRELRRQPLQSARLLAWTAVALAARVGAVAAVGAALGVRPSLASAVIVTAALDVATAFPLTPGNVGIASGAVALALEARGVALPSALAVGVAFHVLETAGGVLFGLAAVPLVARPELANRLVLRAAVAVAAAALVGSVGVGLVAT